MNKPEIKPTVNYGGGSAFRGSTTQAYYPLSQIPLPDIDVVKVVSLAQWCRRNFISRDIGYTLIKKSYLIAFRRHGYWWVTANPQCKTELLEYLGVEKLAFDVEQD